MTTKAPILLAAALLAVATATAAPFAPAPTPNSQAQTPNSQEEPQWIGTSQKGQSIRLQRTFQLKAKTIKTATLKICGLGFYECEINGKPLTADIHAPLWSDYRKTVWYNTYDVKPLMARQLRVDVVLGNGFYCEQGLRYHKLTTDFGSPKLLFDLSVVYADGTTDRLISDQNWQKSPSEITFNSIYGGEDCDMTRPLVWTPAEPQPAPQGQLRQQIAEPVRVLDTYSPVSCRRIAETDLAAASKAVKREVGKTAFVLDMGQNVAGFPRLTVSGSRGQKIVITPAETLTPEGSANQKQTGRPHYYTYTLAGGKTETWSPKFSYYGFRYLMVEGAVMKGQPNPDRLPVIADIQSCLISSTAPKTGHFLCSNELFNRTYQIIDRAIRSNWHSVWTDCPQREKLGWLEQDWLCGEGLVYNYDCRRMLRQTMQNIADAQRADGSVPEIAPEFVDFGHSKHSPFADSPEWGGAIIALPFLCWQHYADKSLIADFYPQMCRYADYLATQDSAYILRQGLGDWYDYDGTRAGFAKNTPVPLIATAHYYLWTHRLAEAAKLLGRTADENKYAARADSIGQAFNREFYDPATHRYGTGSQAAQAVALDMRLVPAQDRQDVLDVLLADIHRHGDRLTTGDVGTRYLFKVLDDCDLQDLLYRMLNHYGTPGYGYQIKQGMTTLTEQWDPTQGSSMNHFMLSHINNHLISSIAGIRINPTAATPLTIEPHPAGDLTWAEGEAQTLHGTVRCRWEKTGYDFCLHVDIPEGDAALVILPSGESLTATAGHHDFTAKSEYRRPLADVMRDVEKRFGVRFKYNVQTDGLSLPYADFRIRPYSLEETLDNICKYFDFNWWKQSDKLYKIKPYEYPRRHVADGEKMLSYLSSLYADKAAWEARRDSLRREVRRRLDIDSLLAHRPPLKPQTGKTVRHDGYTTQDLCLPLDSATHIFATVYAPAAKGRHALIVCPDGHFGGGRYRADEQQRLGTLARMGAVCVDFDLYGWGQSAKEVGAAAHQTARAQQVQAASAITLLDWLLATRKDIDRTRIAANGGSGGGSHTVLLAAIDDRLTAAAPTVNLASHFDGGCPCESGMPIHLSAGGTCNPELLATFAPKPVMLVSDGGDWTASVPTLEYPYLQRIYGFYGAADKISDVHLPDERHDFGPNKRQAVYDFFARTFGLDAAQIDEQRVTIRPEAAFSSYK